MLLQVRVYRNADCLSNNNPCVRESLDVDNTFDYNVLIHAFKLLWSDSVITFSL